MLLTLIGGLCGLVACGLTVQILTHAFRRSLGTGVMALCVPAYLLVYAFSQFEHRRKPLVVAAWGASLVLAAVLLPLGYQALPVQM